MTRRGLVLGAVLISGCGGHGRSTAVGACAGYPQPARAPSGSFSFASTTLTKRDLCAKLGNPRSVRRQRSGRESWYYGPATSFTLQGAKVVSLTANGHTISTAGCGNAKDFARRLLRVARQHPGSASPRVRREAQWLARHPPSDFACGSSTMVLVARTR